MHHRTGLSFVNNISIRNRPPPLVKIILLKEKTDLKKKKKNALADETRPLTSIHPRVLEPQKRYLNIRTVGTALISVSRNMKKRCFARAYTDS